MIVGKGDGKTGLRLWGSIGGGVQEFNAIEEAGALLQNESPAAFSKKCLLRAEAGEGAVCGGEILLFFRVLDAREKGLLEVIDKAIAYSSVENSYEKNFWFIMGNLALGIVWEDGFLFSDGSRPELSPFLRTTPVYIEEKGCFWFSEPLLSNALVYIFGGGHIAQELVPLLARLGFRCVIFDDREDFTLPELFPQAGKIIRGNFEHIEKYLTLTARDYVIIVTHGHLWDLEAFTFALASHAAYIGVIGSETKHEFIRERLKERGLDEAVINAPRVHAPIGIKIKSKSPAEIAVSIAAELILGRAQGVEAITHK
jgi:xanthine dehydrogenase accessory factor